MSLQQFLRAYPLRFWPFTMLLHFSLKKNSPKFASATTRKWSLIARCCNVFCSKTHCILHQNALQYAPKRIAFCIKTHCNMHQNALQYAPKCKVKCCKMQPKPIKSTIFNVIYRHFDHLEWKIAWWRLVQHFMLFCTFNTCQKACFCALFLVNVNKSNGYKL